MRTFSTIVVVLAGLHVNTATAQVALYDNLGVLDEWVSEREWWINPFTSDQLYAQQFLNVDSTTLNEVSVELGRVPGVDGSLSFELWRDDGFDRPLLPDAPDAQIATLGIIEDVTDIPRTRTKYTFDTDTFNPLDVSLEPGEKYWVVANFANVNNLSRGRLHWYTAFWPVPSDFPKIGPIPADYLESQSTLGTNGVAHAHFYRDQNGYWKDFAEHFGEEHEFFVMSVRASGGSVPVGDWNKNGLLDTDDIDLLTMQMAAGPPYDLIFDLSGDEAVDNVDLTEWRTEAATDNGFGEAYLLGDSNLDGSVDATDLNNLALNWRQSVAKWSGGDFTADGVVNAGDLNALALNWRKTIPIASAVNASVPEPSACLLLLFGVLLVWRRPKRT